MTGTRNIIVVGAGPAGLSFALTMASRKHKVTVLERFRDVETAFCGEYVSRSQLVHRELFEDCFRSGTKNVNVKFIDENYRTLSEKVIPNEDLVLMDSRCMKRNMMDAGKKAGVNFIFNAHVKSISRQDDGVQLEIGSDGITYRIHADIVIGADGSNSLVRRNLLPRAAMKTLPSVREQYYVKGYPEGEFRFYLGGPFKFGYGWTYPGEMTDDGLLVNIGVGFISDYVDSSVSAFMDSFIEYLESTGIKLTRMASTGVKGNMIPYSGIVKPAGGEAVLLLGDALGTVNALVGGGVTYALSSGVVAADYLDTKLESGDLDFTDWYDRVKERPCIESIEHTAEILKIGEMVYSRESKFFDYLAEALGEVDDMLLYEVSTGKVRRTELIRFIISHPVISARIVMAMKPLILMRELRNSSEVKTS